MQQDAREASEGYARPYHVPFYNLRWSAVFAGLAVGISANLFLLLLGGAAGLAMFNSSMPVSDQDLLLAASLWNSLSMILAALLGGYVAARAAALRRTADGVLHGAVVWGITVLLSALLATSAIGATLNGMFAMPPGRPVSADAALELELDADGKQRQAVVDVLESRLGLSRAQANHIVNQALILAGQEAEAEVSEEDIADARRTLHAATVAGSWLSSAILLSLLAAIGGGLLGARGTRRAIVGIEPHRPPASEALPTP